MPEWAVTPTDIASSAMPSPDGSCSSPNVARRLREPYWRLGLLCTIGLVLVLAACTSRSTVTSTAVSTEAVSLGAIDSCESYERDGYPVFVDIFRSLDEVKPTGEIIEEGQSNGYEYPELSTTVGGQALSNLLSRGSELCGTDPGDIPLSWCPRVQADLLVDGALDQTSLASLALSYAVDSCIDAGWPNGDAG